jgi:2'-5' RNA ligase
MEGNRAGMISGGVIPMATIQRELTAGIGFFFALLPDDDARASIATISERFRKSHRVDGAAVDPADFHVALCPMGSPERPLLSVESSLLAAAETVKAVGFALTLDSAMRFSLHDSRFPFVLLVDSVAAAALLQLRQALAAAQRSVGLHVGGVSSYMPHVALLQGHAIDPIQEAIAPISWQVREFVLIRSFFGKSRHEVVQRWALDEPIRQQPEVFDLSNLPDLDDLPDIDYLQ